MIPAFAGMTIKSELFKGPQGAVPLEFEIGQGYAGPGYLQQLDAAGLGAQGIRPARG